MKFNNHEELRAFLWEKLGLKKRAITFHMIDVGDAFLYFWPGIIDDSGDLWESEGLSDIGTSHCDEPEIEVFSVESFMIGDGESDRADYEDCDLLEEINKESPDVMDAFLKNCAECLVSFGDFKIENPEYEEFECEDD